LIEFMDVRHHAETPPSSGGGLFGLHRTPCLGKASAHLRLHGAGVRIGDFYLDGGLGIGVDGSLGTGVLGGFTSRHFVATSSEEEKAR
jgi:hypothetical protein